MTVHPAFKVSTVSVPSNAAWPGAQQVDQFLRADHWKIDGRRNGWHGLHQPASVWRPHNDAAPAPDG
jgi:hypothetical protein